MDTAVMVRVALLIITTGLFAALWSGDQSEQIASAGRPSRVIVAHREATRISGNSVGSVGTMATPLPARIVAGTYLVSDQWGRTHVRVLSARDVSSARGARQPQFSNHYMVELGVNRWHYIRLDRSPIDQSNRTRTDSYR